MRKLFMLAVLLAVCITARQASAELGTLRPCRGAVLLHVPLTSKTEEYRAKSLSGFTVIVGKFEAGWAVSVFAPNDRAERDDLLPPRGEWNGYYSVAFWVLPETDPKLWFPYRRVKIRSSQIEVCLQLHEAKSVADPWPRFVGGTLVVYWVDRPAPN